MKVASLFFIALVSFLLMVFLNWNIGGNSDSLFWIRFLAPGIIFSVYMVLLIKNKLSWQRALFFILIGVVCYILNIAIGFITWGFGVPIAGAFGAVIIKFILHQKSTWDNEARLLFMIGFACGLAGIIIFYLIRNINEERLGFGLILLFWQLGVGLKVLKGMKENKYS